MTAPFIHTEKNAPYIYLTRLAALMPCVVFAVFAYGIRAIILLSLSVAGFMLTDIVAAKLIRRHAKGEYFDVSSIVSGLTFGLLLSPETPVTAVIAGILFGSVIVKQLFGGAGSNILFPATAAVLFTNTVFPSSFSGFSKPLGDWFAFVSIVSGKVTNPDYSGLSYPEIISGFAGSLLGVSCCLMILIGLVFMLVKGTIRIYAPAGYMLTLLAGFPLTHISTIFSSQGLHQYVLFILSSGVMFIAVYCLGDYTTVPSRPLSAVTAGIVCGVFTLILYGRVSDVTMLVSPVVAVNFMSFVLDYFSKSISRRGRRSREVDLL